MWIMLRCVVARTPRTKPICTALFVFAVASLCVSALRTAPHYRMRFDAPQYWQVEQVSTYSCPHVVATEWAFAMPKPEPCPSEPEIDEQMAVGGFLLTDVLSVPVALADGQKSGATRPIFFNTVPATSSTQNSITVTSNFKVCIQPRRLVLTREEDPPGWAAPTLSAVERATNLLESASIDYNSRDFKNWLDWNGLRVGAGESQLAFGYRVFRFINRAFQYNYNPKQTYVVSRLINSQPRDCARMSSIFIAAMRANQLPARLLVGRYLQSGEPHVKAEFFAEDLGWIPVDLGSASVSQSIDDFFGVDRGDLLVMHTNYDFVCHYAEKDFPIGCAQNPSMLVSGSGRLDGSATSNQWRAERAR